MAQQRQFQGSSIVYESEMDGGEAAMERAMRRALTDADLELHAYTWEVVDTQVHRVVGFGTTKYTATVTVEVNYV